METLKLLLITIGFLILIVGFFFIAFTLLGKKKNTDGECESNSEATRSFGCGCGTGACGLPSDGIAPK
jgi:hypothetical protein